MYAKITILLVITIVISYNVQGRYLPTIIDRQRRDTNYNEISQSISARIIGGSDVEEGSTPFVVSIQNSKGQHICSGVIVSSEWILTTAYCTINTAKGLHVAAGSNNLNTSTAIYEVDGITVHPSYHLRDPASDVSLLHLSEPITFTSTIQAAMIPKEDNMQDGDHLMIAGWGRRQLNVAMNSNTLQKLLVTYRTNSYCKSQLPQLQVGDGSFCVQPPAYTGACHGDAGSPVLDANLRVMGLISLGIPCAQGYPDVAVSIADKYSWIKRITKK